MNNQQQKKSINTMFTMMTPFHNILQFFEVVIDFREENV